MKNNQNGFAAVEAALVLVIVGILGFTGWFVLNAKKNTDASLSSNNSTTPAINKNSEAKPVEQTKIDTTVHEVDIKLQTTADLGKLPAYTPASFKAYMSDILKDNQFVRYSGNDVDTILEYQISKISSVNISGGRVPVDKAGQGQVGGAPAIWVLTSSGTWDQETLNGPVCKSKNGGAIYEEFVKECYVGTNTSEMVKNPNGSITTINN